MSSCLAAPCGTQQHHRSPNTRVPTEASAWTTSTTLQLLKCRHIANAACATAAHPFRGPAAFGTATTTVDRQTPCALIANERKANRVQQRLAVTVTKAHGQQPLATQSADTELATATPCWRLPNTRIAHVETRARGSGPSAAATSELEQASEQRAGRERVPTWATSAMCAMQTAASSSLQRQEAAMLPGLAAAAV